MIYYEWQDPGARTVGMDRRCYLCGELFTDDEWEDRHTDEETGEDIHERCCQKCKKTALAAMDGKQ